jgi:hypothetical protein
MTLIPLQRWFNLVVFVKMGMIVAMTIRATCFNGALLAFLLGNTSP